MRDIKKLIWLSLYGDPDRLVVIQAQAALGPLIERFEAVRDMYEEERRIRDGGS